MEPQQRAIFLEKALTAGAASLLSLGLGLGWATRALANEDALEGKKLYPDGMPSPAVEWMSQVEASQVQITAVRLESTEAGLSLVLETAEGELPMPRTQTAGNTLTADIPNAVLALPEDEMFERVDPAEGIAQISVMNMPDGGVRVSIMGTDAPPQAQVDMAAGDLLLSIVPRIATTIDADDAEDDTEDDTVQVVVLGERAEGYNPSSATTATRTDTPLRNVPQSIQVIPQQVVEDQQAITLQELLRNAAGVAPGPNQINSSNLESFFIRGFNQSTLFRNGFPTRSTGPQDLAGVERVEILRGPASVLYGQIEPGGVVNVVTKKPLSEPFYEVSGQVGSYDFYRPSFDVSGLLSEDGSASYRLNLAYTNSDSFRDFVESESIYVAPVVSLQFSENTSLVLDLEYLDDHRTWDEGVPVIGDRPGDVPIEQFFGDPDDFREVQDIFTGYELRHEFNQNWKLRNAFRYHNFQLDREYLFIGSFQDDNRTLNRDFVENSLETEEFNLVTDVTGEFSTGSLDHVLLIGLDLRRQTVSNDGAFGPGTPIDIFAPVNESPVPTDLEEFANREVVEWAGLYVQDQISILENLDVLIGGRFDIVSQSSEDLLDPDNDADQQDEAFSPRVGFVYRPIEPISLYASYSRSFSPEAGFTADGSPFDPTRGEQFEVGVKTELLDGRLSSTLAFYDLRKRNIVVDDPDNSGFSIQVGEQRNQGIEFDVSGEILPGLNVIATYAYIDAVFEDASEVFNDNRPNNVPRHSGSLWLAYEFQEGDLQGLGLGAGAFFVGDRPGDGTFSLPSYTTVDLAGWYEFSIGSSDARVQLNVKNLFDTEYYEGTNRRTRTFPGDPLTVLGSISIQF